MSAHAWRSRGGTSAPSSSAPRPWSTRSSASTRRRWLALVAFALSATAANAQLLDLDSPETNAVEHSRAGEALARLLLERAELIDSREPDSPRAELRRLAAALLGARRPIPVLIGRTMAGRLDELDRLATAPALDDVDRVLLVGALRRARSDIPVSTEQLDRSIRLALTRLGEGVSPPPAPGWAVLPGPDMTNAPSLERSVELLAGWLRDAGANEPCARLASIVRTAAGRPLYAHAGERLGARLRLACALLDDPPPWVGEHEQRDAAAGIARACARLLDPATRHVGGDMLDRYAGLDRLIRACARLEASNDARALREALIARLDDPPTLDAIEAMSRGLEVALGDAVFDRDESTLVRQLRPAWRWVSRRATLESRAIVPRLASLLEVDSPLTDPATLALLSTAQTPTATAHMLVALSDLLDDDPQGPSARPRAFGERGQIAEHVLGLAKSLDDPAGEASARAQLELLLDDLRRAEALCLENPEGSALASASARARDGVLIAWADEGGDADAARAAVRRLERLSALRRAVRLAETLRSGEARAQRWAWVEISPGGVEISPGGVEACWEGLGREVEKATALALRGEDARLERALATLESRYGVVRALLAIEERLTAMGACSGETWSVLSEIALGPPDDDAWLIDQRERLATLCLLIEELAAARIRDDRPAARDLREALNATGERLLRAIEGR